MLTANEIKSISNLKTETFEYKYDEKTYLISLSFNIDEIIFNLKDTLPFQYYDEYEEKFNYSELKNISSFFSQFSDADKIGDLFINLLKGKKIIISEDKKQINFSFKNITDEIINIIIKKKEFVGDEKYEKLSEIVKSLINQIKELKEENKKIIENNHKMQEQLDQMIKFKLEIEEKRKKKLEKYHKLKNSKILNDEEKINMISNWIMPNRKIIYNQIYAATRDEGTGVSFHSHCDNKGPTLTLIESTNGYIFGGYISISWEGPSGWTYKGNDDNAFIFSINNKLKYPIQDKSKVIYNESKHGPDFGNNDIYLVNENFLAKSDNQCNCTSYKAPPEKIAGGKNFQIKELEVYTVQFDHFI